MPAAAKGPVGDLTKEVAATLRAQVAHDQLTQLEVAKLVGMSQSQVSKILRGDGHIDLDQLDAFAAALGLNVVKVLEEAERAASVRARTRSRRRQARVARETPQSKAS